MSKVSMIIFCSGFMLKSTLVNCQARTNILIRSAFKTWEQKQYETGVYIPRKLCDSNSEKNTFRVEKKVGLSEIKFYYFDFNLDGKLDALVTFNPYLCDGGLALSNKEEKLLVLSKGLKYTVDDISIKIIERKYKGWFIIKGVRNTGIYGIYARGGRAPEYTANYSLNYQSKKITFKP